MYIIKEFGAQTSMYHYQRIRSTDLHVSLSQRYRSSDLLIIKLSRGSRRPLGAQISSLSNYYGAQEDLIIINYYGALYSRLFTGAQISLKWLITP